MSENWLVDGGEMGRMIRARDWAETPLGPIEAWPQSLRTTVGLCLASNFPINLIWGPKHTQIFNDGYWPICGDKVHQVLGSNYRECWASAWSALSDAFENALQGKTSFLENQRMFLDRNGYLEETFFTFSLSPIRDETGRVSGLFHPVTETTARMLAERRSKALRELTARLADAKTVDDVYRSTFELLGTFEFDISFALIYEFNRDGTQAERVGQVGFKTDTANNPQRIRVQEYNGVWPLLDLAKDGPSQLVSNLAIQDCGPYAEPIRNALALPLRTGAEHAAGALILGASSRLSFDAMYSDFFGFVATTISTAMINARAYEDEKRKAEELAALDQAKTTFFSNISHEFRTPLTLMLVPLEELLNRSPAELNHQLVRERLEVIHRNSLRLLKLVNNLLDFSRIEAGRSVASFRATALEQLTLDLISSFRSTAEVSGINIITELEGTFEPVYVDRDMWEKIVLNILSNAFKYTLSGFIKITMVQADGLAKISIRDSGMGIAASDLPHLFERFYRVHESQGRSYEGSGIGLAMVHELVKLHGGRIEVDSEIGKGSTFTVTIPLGKAHLPKDQIESSERPIGISQHTSDMFLAEVKSFAQENPLKQVPSQPTARERILLIDDNSDMRETISKLLADQYEVTCASDGLAGFEQAQTIKPDLILCDIMMPKLNGFGLVKKIRADSELQTTPVILVSARAGEEAKVEGFERGADDYLTKPFSSKELLARVAAHLSMSRTRSTAERRERELLAEVEGVKRSNQLKDEFLATVSHELRTPLNAILGFSHMLRSDSSADSSYFDTAIDAIIRNAELQNRIVNDLLDMSSMITGKMRLESKELLMADVVKSAIESVSLSAKAKQIELLWNPPKQSSHMLGDAGRLQQVMWNLLSNAIRFSPVHSCITISLATHDGLIHVSVKDQGEGMAVEFLPFAFDALRQENGSTTRKHGGLGLGLKIVKHIVEAHGGTVAIASEGKGRGTEITISLPVAASEPTAKPRPLQGLSILTVDDDLDAQLMVKILLNRAGADVQTASSAAEAWNILAEKKPDILLSDIGMPTENGYELLKRLRALPSADLVKTIPAIALTAWTREEDKRLAYEAGFQEHLAKPIKGQTLIDTVARLTGRARG